MTPKGLVTPQTDTGIPDAMFKSHTKPGARGLHMRTTHEDHGTGLSQATPLASCWVGTRCPRLSGKNGLTHSKAQGHLLLKIF